MKQEQELYRIEELLAHWFTKISLRNARGLYDINKTSQDLALRILNEIFDYQLINLDRERHNHPGVDLGDKKNQIAFQITSQTDNKKIKDSLDKFVKGGFDKIYKNGIRFLILILDGKKIIRRKNDFKKIYPKFDKDRHILTGIDLIKEIEKIYNENPEKFRRIREILETEIGYFTKNETFYQNKSIPEAINPPNSLSKDYTERLEKRFSHLLDKQTRQLCQKIFDNGRFPSSHLMGKYRDELIGHLENSPEQLSLDARMQGLITVADAYLMSDEKEAVGKARKYYNRAFEVYRRLEDNSRWYEKLQRILALLLFYEDKADDAINSLAPLKEPQSISLRLDLLIKADKLEEALRWLSCNEVNAEWAGQAIHVYVHSEMLEKAEKLFEDTSKDYHTIRIRNELEGSPYQNDAYYEKLNFRMVQALYLKAIKIIDKSPGGPIYPADLTPKAQTLLDKTLKYTGKFFEQASRQNPGSNWFSEQMLRIEISAFYFLGKFDQFDQGIPDLLSLQPIDKEIVGLILARHDRYDIEILKGIPGRLVKDYPDDWRAWLKIAEIKIILEDKEGAWDAALKASEWIKTDDEKMDFVFVVMEISSLTGRLEDAPQVFKNYFPNDTDKTTLIEGLYYWFSGKRKDAVRILGNVGDKKLNNYHKANIKAFMGEYAAGKERWKKSKKFYYESLEYAKNPSVMRRLLYVLGKLQEAEEVLRITKEIESLGFADEYIIFIKAQALRNLRKFPESEKAYRTLYAKDSENPEYALKFADVLRLQDKNDEALSVLQKFTQPDESLDPRCLGLASEIYQLEGKPQIAFQTLEKCLPKIQETPDLLINYMNLAFKIGDEKKANAILSKIQRLKEDGKISDDVLRICSIDEIVKFFTQENKESDILLERYAQGEISRTHVCQHKGIPSYIDWAYRTQERVEKYLNIENRRDFSIYSTNSFNIYVNKEDKAEISRIEAPGEIEEIVVEINALITIHQLGLLEKLSSRYKKIFYPEIYHRILKQERNYYSPHQPAREKIYKDLYGRIQNREIIEISLELPGKEIHFPERSLALAQNERIPLVDDYIEKENLEKFNDVVALRVCDIADFLYEKGRLGEDKRKEIKKIFANKPSLADCNWKTVLLDKRRLLASTAALEVMEKFALIQEFLRMGIEILVEKSNAGEIKNQVNTLHSRDKVRERQEYLLRKIKENPKFQSFSTTLTKKEYDVIDNVHSEAMLHIIKFAHKSRLALLTDDRWFQMAYNKFLAKHAFGTDNLLKNLCDKDIITIEEYADAFLKLCKWRYCFILPDSRVLVFYAEQYKKSLPGNQLKSLANYFRNAMENPGLFTRVGSTNPPLSIGMTYYLTVVEIWLEFLVTIWKDKSFDTDNLKQITEWFYCCALPGIPGNIPGNKRVLLHPTVEEIWTNQLLSLTISSTEHIRLNPFLDKSFDYLSWKPEDKIVILREFIEQLSGDVGENELLNENISREGLRLEAAIRACEVFYGKHISDIRLPVEIVTALQQIGLTGPFPTKKVKAEELKSLAMVLDEEIESLKNIQGYREQRFFVVNYPGKDSPCYIFHDLTAHPAVEIRKKIIELISLSDDMSNYSKEKIIAKRELIISDDKNISPIESLKAEKIILKDFHYIKSLLDDPKVYYGGKLLNEVWENIFNPDLNTVTSKLPFILQADIESGNILNRIDDEVIEQFDDINSILDWYLKEIFFMPVISPNIWEIIQIFRSNKEKNNETNLPDEDIFHLTKKWIENKKDPLAYLMAFQIFLEIVSQPGKNELIESEGKYKDKLLELLLPTELPPRKIEENIFENVRLRWLIRWKFSQYYLKYIDLNLQNQNRLNGEKKAMMAWWMASEVERTLLNHSQGISLKDENDWLERIIISIIDRKNQEIYFEHQFHRKRGACSLSIYYTLFSFPSIAKITLSMIYFQDLSEEQKFSLILNNASVMQSTIKALLIAILTGEGQRIPSNDIPLYHWDIPLNLSGTSLLKGLAKSVPGSLKEAGKFAVDLSEFLVNPHYLKNELKNFQATSGKNDFFPMTVLLGALKAYAALHGKMPEEAKILKGNLNSKFNITLNSPWGLRCLFALIDFLKQLFISGITDYSEVLLNEFKESDLMNLQLKDEATVLFILDLIEISYLSHDLSVLKPILDRKSTDKIVREILEVAKLPLKNIITRFPHSEREYIRKILNELEDIV